jgi:hypothetical protein
MRHSSQYCLKVGSVRLELVRDQSTEADADRPGTGTEATPQRVRLVDAALRCIARQGIAKTTLDDVARAADLEDVLVAGMTEAAVRITEHPGLSYLLDHEPELVLPHLTFSHMDSVLGVSSTFTAPFLGRWLDHEEAKRVAEWGARIVLSHLLCPADGVDLTDETRVRRLVRTFVLPGDEAATDTAHVTDITRSTRTTKGEAS